MNENPNLPEFTSVTDMARMMGLSRQRFYQLMKKGLVPPPLVEDDDSRRPYYDRNLQELCMEVRRRNRGINGKPILFYSRRASMPARAAKRRASKPKSRPSKSLGKYAGLVDALATLGVETTPAAQKALVAYVKLVPLSDV